MRRRVFQIAFVLIVCTSWPSIGQAQSDSALIAKFNNHNQAYATAISTGDYDTAQQHWDLMRPVARELVSRGHSNYAGYDREMVRPGGSQQLGTGQDPSDPPEPEQQPVQPITFLVIDELEIEVEANCHESTVILLNETQTGFEEDLVDIEVVVHARLFDHHGNLLETAYFSAGSNIEEERVDFLGMHEFKLSFPAEGFADIYLPIDVQLKGPCLSIEPLLVGLGTTRAPGITFQTFTIANTCDEPLEVEIPFGDKETDFKAGDCSGGPTSLGSAVQGGGRKAMLGPGARCEVSVIWTPESEGLLNRSYSIKTDEDLPINCYKEVRVVGAASLGISVSPREVRFEEVTRVGDTTSARLIIRNQSSDQNLILVSDHITGRDAGAFSHWVDTFEGGYEKDKTLVLEPGGVCSNLVEFAPKSDGEKWAELEIRSTDPVVSVVRIPLSGLAENP